MTTLGHTLKPMLKHRNLTQQKAADMLNISRQQLNEILKRAEATDTLIDKIEKTFEIEGALTAFRPAQQLTPSVINQKLIEQYERRLTDKDDLIQHLKTTINTYEKILNSRPTDNGL